MNNTEFRLIHTQLRASFSSPRCLASVNDALHQAVTRALPARDATSALLGGDKNPLRICTSAICCQTYWHVDPDDLAPALDEAEAATFIYPETDVVGYYNPADLPAIGTGVPACAVDAMMFPVNLVARTKGATMHIDRREPDRQIVQNGRENANYAQYSRYAGVDRVIEEKPEIYGDWYLP